ncbi:MAG: hypothetical protein AAGA55_08915, partial [Planctomycetota bacterium]
AARAVFQSIFIIFSAKIPAVAFTDNEKKNQKTIQGKSVRNILKITFRATPRRWRASSAVR